MSINELFIVGSCRTGSTPIYQLVINLFDVFYFTNLINKDYYENPALGCKIQKDSILSYNHNSYDSDYGKTEGDLGPSEGSSIFQNWFGGGHPSEIKSFDFLSIDKKNHMIKTINDIHDIMEKMIVIKNAWNIFRIKVISKAFPNSRFLWIRRDIREASLSSLNARYYRDDLNAWNTATPKNYKELCKLPPYQQVVEQHYELDKTIKDNIPKGRYIEIWYEDLCLDTENTVKRLKKYFNMNVNISEIPKLQIINSKEIEKGDHDKIIEYSSNQKRFEGYKYDINNNNNL